MRVRWSRIVLLILTIFTFGIYAVLTIAGVAMNNQPKPPRIPDETPPTVVLKGGETVTVAINAPYKDDGVDAYDDRSEVQVSSSGEVDTTKEGE